jgi:hypothetical protein
MQIETCWALGQRWYAGRMALDWQRPGAEETQKLFADLGLTGTFWSLL